MLAKEVQNTYYNVLLSNKNFVLILFYKYYYDL